MGGKGKGREARPLIHIFVVSLTLTAAFDGRETVL